MKKIVIVFIAAISCIMMLFVGCGKEPETQQPIDLANCEIGYEIEVYPNYSFYYKINDTCTVCIKSINVILTEKNEISEGDTLNEPFCPYKFTVEASGSTSEINYNKTIYMFLKSSNNPANLYTIPSIVDNSGNILWTYTISNIANIDTLYFYYLSF